MNQQLDVKLQEFEGPLALLLHLIDRNKVSIFDIPIVEITAQYMDYLNSLEETDLESMSDFLVMAVTLLEIKTRFLMPSDEEDDEEEEDPRQALVEQLLEYKKYRYLGENLKGMSEGSDMRIFAGERLPEEVKSYRVPPDLDRMFADVTAERLKAVFEEVMRHVSEKADKNRSGFGHITRETVTVESRIARVRRIIGSGRRKSFRELLSANKTKLDTIVTFLAILELMKIGELHLTEDSTANDFMIEGSGYNAGLPAVASEMNNDTGEIC